MFAFNRICDASLADAQTALAGATEKERAASEQLMEVKVRVKTLETQLATVKQEKSRLAAQLDMEKTKCIVLEDTKNRYVSPVQKSWAMSPVQMSWSMSPVQTSRSMA